LPDIRQIGAFNEKHLPFLPAGCVTGTPILIGESNIDHIIDRHPEDYQRYGQHLEIIIALPDYLGSNPNDGSIRYVKEFDKYVHVGVRVTVKGNYFARSLYVITDTKLQNYVKQGHLYVLKHK